jgi:hypothetical protein
VSVNEANLGAKMIKRLVASLGLTLVSCVTLVICISGSMATRSRAATTNQKEAAMTARATGPFDVKLAPQDPNDTAPGSTLGRMSLDKQYHGDLEATAKGQMLTAMTYVKGSAGYVAIERVTGTLKGRSGSFVLQHSGTLNRGAQLQSVTVVPDSGTGQLTGIAGKMTIVIAADGKHSYEFEYSLTETH